MKTPILPIILAGLPLAILDGGSVAAPVLPAGQPKEIASFQAHPYDIETLAFSPDGKILASGDGEGKLKLWAMRNGEKIADIQAHRRTKRAHGMLRGLAFSPDGKTLVTCDDDGNAKQWDVVTGKNTDTLDARLLAPLRFSPDGETLVSKYELFDLKAKKAAPLMKNLKGYLTTLAFDPKGKLLIATSSSWPEPPCIWLWDPATGKQTVTCKGYKKDLMGLAFSRDGKTLASAGYDQTVRLWNTSTAENTATFDKLPKWNSCALTFSPDGKVLAMGYGRNRDSIIGSILLLDVPSGKILATLKGDSDAITCQAFSPDGRLLASGGLDGIIKIWNLPARYKAE